MNLYQIITHSLEPYFPKLKLMSCRDIAWGDVTFFEPSLSKIQRVTLEKSPLFSKVFFDPPAYVNLRLKDRLLWECLIETIKKCLNETVSTYISKLSAQEHTCKSSGYFEKDLLYVFARSHSILNYAKENFGLYPLLGLPNELTELSLDYRVLLLHLSNFQESLKAKNFLRNYLKKLVEAFDNVWKNSPSDYILRFINPDNLELTKCHLLLVFALQKVILYSSLILNIPLVEEINE